MLCVKADRAEATFFGLRIVKEEEVEQRARKWNDCLGESSWRNKPFLLHWRPHSLHAMPASPPKGPEMINQVVVSRYQIKTTQQSSNFRINDLEKAKFQQTLCYLSEDAFLPNVFTLSSSITIVGVFSSKCSFFYIFQKLGGGEIFWTVWCPPPSKK